VLLPKTPYTQQQPTGLAGDCVLASALDLGCWLVVEQFASRPHKNFSQKFSAKYFSKKQPNSGAQKQNSNINRCNLLIKHICGPVV
jgi:hypothetical protein